jgi:hypothetical protein
LQSLDLASLLRPYLVGLLQSQLPIMRGRSA